MTCLVFFPAEATKSVTGRPRFGFAVGFLTLPSSLLLAQI